MKIRTFRHRRVVRRRLSLLLSGALAAGLIQVTASPAEALPGWPAGQVSSDHPVEGKRGTTAEPRAKDEIPAHPTPLPHSWPKPQNASVDLGAVEGKGTRHLRQAGKSPLSLAPTEDGTTASRATSKARTRGGHVPGTVATEVLSEKRAVAVGVRGLLFTLSPAPAPTDTTTEDADHAATPGPVSVGVDYSSFAGAYGGSYASRLRLVEYPACLLSSPEKAACRTARPVASRNDTQAQSLSAATVPLSATGPTVLAAVADTEGGKGDYKATSLTDAASWSTDLNSGDFNWSYDFGAPGVPGGLAPSLSLSYSSGTLDGRTTNTNNQSSWVGDGFDLGTGSIERRYQPCADDGEKKNADGNRPGDLCWDYDNAFLSFNGKGGELVPTGADTFKLQDDDGTRIARLRSTDRNNGDADGEYWRVTDPSGTRYYFGYNRLPGWAEGDETTDSVYTVPVFGNNTSEPCHKDDFASSYCQQGWRWNLDYVVDTHGNAMSYHYTKEENSYGRNLKVEDDTRYTRGGYLKRIDYGIRSSRVFADKPLAQVVFSNAERCLPQSGVTCETSTIKDKATYWYDTPWDLNCDSGTKCDKGRLSPSFWTRKRLTGLTTQALQPNGTYDKIDSWSFGHEWGMADTDYQLLLKSIQHTGASASTAMPPITLPKTTFAYTQLANRLDKTGDGYAPFIKSRLTDIDGETGSRTSVLYSSPACDAGALPKPETNTTRCYPQYLDQDPDATSTEIQWFNKYVTSQVTASDRTGGAEDMVTRYEYLGPAAWHYNDSDGLTRKKYRTWDQWRGYGQVRVLTGGSQGLKSQQDTYFLRGMDGDRKDVTGGTKSVSVTLSSGEGDPITDLNPYAGSTYKTVTYDKPGGKILGKSVSHPWHHEMAKRTRDWGTVTSDLTGTSQTVNWTSLDAGAGVKWRTTQTDTTYETVAGRPSQVNDLGDTSTSADDQCTRTTYADNAADNILDATSRVETVAKACTATVDRTKDVVSDDRNAYDGGAYGAAPSRGDVTAAASLKSYTGTKATYLESGTTYDSYGRELTTTDLTANVTVDGNATPVRTARNDGRVTTTSYTPATGLPTQVKTVTPPAKTGDSSTSLTTTHALDPRRGQPVTETDANGNATYTAYDALGRTIKIWLAGRHLTDRPDYAYSYQIADGKPTVVGEVGLNNAGGATRPTYTFYDGLLRERQTQAPGPAGGTLVADTFYDNRGLVEKSFDSYFTTGSPSTSLFQPDNALTVESQIHTAYDGLGRATQSQHIAGNGSGETTVLSTTKTIYGGDRTTVIPPVGATATTTLTDARGRTSELRQLHQRDIGADADVTTYAYDSRGQLAGVRDPAGNKWTYTFDQLGRQTSATDPDKGTYKTSYDDRGQVTSTTDARGIGLYSLYDGLGRKTQLREGSASGTLRAEWTYDSLTNGKGLPVSTTRYEDGYAYTAKVGKYDPLGRATQQSVIIPAAKGKPEEHLAGTYQSATSYLPSGLVNSTSTSPVGSLPASQVYYTYDDDTLLPATVGTAGIKGTTAYNQLGLTQSVTVGPTDSAKATRVANTYERGTRRLATQTVSRWEQPGEDRYATYHYDEAGNITSVADTSRTGTDNQCYIYDYLGRLTEAWAQGATTCSGSPATAALGGPAPYWQTFTYDLTGNRTTEIQHDLTGQSAKNTKSTYTYPPAGADQPAHGLGQVNTVGPSGTRLDRYTYDPAGNTETRPGQTLVWDAENHLSSVTEENGTKTSYLYDPDGNRLIARTPTETTLYLGAAELTLAKGATKPKATRYTDLGGGITAVQDDDGSFSYTIPDHQGTGQLAIDANTLAIQQRRTTPFGQPRGTAPTDWPGTKGFVGGTDDTEATGLQHLGAREYDPAIGRFISVDPIMDLADPQQSNGYAYANSSPVTSSDPTGLQRPMLDTTGGESRPMPGSDNCYQGNMSASCDGKVGTHPSGGSSHGSAKSGTSTYTPAKNSKRSNVKKLITRKKDATPEQVASAWMSYGSHLERNDFWDTRVGFGGRTSLACYGALACQKAYQEWISTRDFDKARNIAATYCLDNEDECGEAEKQFKISLALVDGITAALEARSGTRGRAVCGQHSFLAGTEVELADGTTKAIEDVRTGDKVLATDPETGKTREREVIATIVTETDKDFTRLTVQGEGKKSLLAATDTHPFWSPDRHEWIDAGDLKAGDLLRTSSGDSLEISAIRHDQQRKRTYDLTVDRTHTYYVLAGQTPVLVHNSPCPNGKLSDPLPRGMNNKIASAYDDVKAGRIPSHDTYGGREHPWWAGSKEYRVPGRPETDRILEKELPNGVKVYGWTSTHYTKIQRFSAPHFPDAGWN
ncbi:polymorphic toxin-type HINT domain-containing protein [Streptomyces sp. NPDC007088]|uniref:polymorphic toxin-type HINT domain-containing protein n=1 Tax=Streptomyces sp. NPDC007088 TaxID=3364773 RepID=UPI0036CB5839